MRVIGARQGHRIKEPNGNHHDSGSFRVAIEFIIPANAVQDDYAKSDFNDQKRMTNCRQNERCQPCGKETSEQPESCIARYDSTYEQESGYGHAQCFAEMDFGM